jgi:nicotinamide-nucleotide amidase
MTREENRMVDLTRLTGPITERLIAAGETVAVAETSAGGLVSAALLAVPGASAYYLGGGVLYTINAREGLAGITDADMAGMRSSSEPFAELLANRLRERLGATWGLAETGAAGPTGNRYGDAAGHSCLAVAGPVSRVRTLETASSDRQVNMWTFADAALTLFDECLKSRS